LELGALHLRLGTYLCSLKPRVSLLALLGGLGLLLLDLLDLFLGLKDLGRIDVLGLQAFSNSFWVSRYMP